MKGKEKTNKENQCIVSLLFGTIVFAVVQIWRIMRMPEMVMLGKNNDNIPLDPQFFHPMASKILQRGQPMNPIYKGHIITHAYAQVPTVSKSESQQEHAEALLVQGDDAAEHAAIQPHITNMSRLSQEEMEVRQIHEIETEEATKSVLEVPLARSQANDTHSQSPAPPPKESFHHDIYIVALVKHGRLGNTMYQYASSYGIFRQ